MHPVHPQYLGMIDVDVVMCMLRRMNEKNGVPVITLAIDWYDGLGEIQPSDHGGVGCGPGVDTDTQKKVFRRYLNPEMQRLLGVFRGAVANRLESFLDHHTLQLSP